MLNPQYHLIKFQFLHWQEGRHQEESFLLSALSDCVAQIDKLEARHVSSLLWSLARLGRVPPVSCASQICQHALNIAGEKSDGSHDGEKLVGMK